jgi:hypothetical protein
LGIGYRLLSEAARLDNTRDIACIFDDLEGFANGVIDRVVGGLNPNFTPAFGDTPVYAGVKLATA